jgi:alanine-alpha-ketoisovalerate/valine-pyruvate aminotransferase
MLQGTVNDIDYDKISCDNIDEINKVFGIGAARNKVITELLNFNELSSLDAKHLELIADEMIQSGDLGKISRTGANKRIDNALHSIANFG